MPNVRLVIEYDGAQFHGWQKQTGLRTVQGELHKMLELILREKISCVFASGRTDAGVHAKRQVVNFHCQGSPDLYVLKHAVSSLLRGELGVLEAEFVSPDFHSQHCAKRKQYLYTILNRPAPPVLDRGKVWHVSSKLAVAKMQQEAAVLVGEHDFNSFRAQDCTSVTSIKTILESEIISAGDYLYYRVVGTGFLKQMVRIIVGTLVAIGRGRQEPDSVATILERKDRRCAGPTAPAHGLCLDWVKY